MKFIVTNPPYKMSKDGGGLRHNTGKTRHDLTPAYAQEQYARVITVGAQKYADRNWERGMPWSKVIASLERHFQSIKAGEDYDPETGLLHSAHVMCNAAFLTEYYKIFPQGDDRNHAYLSQKRIGMDIDGVLADFVGPYCRRFDVREAESWDFDPLFLDRYRELEDHFFENLPSITHPRELPYEPVAYITQRSSKREEATHNWLFENNNYPFAPVIFAQDKLASCKELKLDAFVDDNFQTFVHLNSNGVLCYLFDAPHNRRYNVGHKRITKETLNRLI